jgi:class 3 adenylate cyclase
MIPERGRLSVVRELPRGTVTFLFTDIEGSTRLLHELGPDEYAARLAEHRRVLREAFERHGGVEVDTQGDAFLYAFADPVETSPRRSASPEMLTRPASTKTRWRP